MHQELSITLCTVIQVPGKSVVFENGNDGRGRDCESTKSNHALIQRIACPNIKVKPSPPINSLSRNDSRERSGLIVFATQRSVLVFALAGTELSAT
jgi:hypothetical protein